MFYLNSDKIPEHAPIAQLDAVLKTLAESKNAIGLEKPAIVYGSNTVVDGKVMPRFPDIDLVLAKLIKDEYIQLKPASAPNTKNKYAITFEGYFFITEEFGYQGRRDFRLSDKARLEKLETIQRNTQVRIMKLTRWLVVGAIGALVVALAVLAWQMYSFYHPIPLK